MSLTPFVVNDSSCKIYLEVLMNSLFMSQFSFNSGFVILEGLRMSDVSLTSVHPDSFLDNVDNKGLG